MNELLTRITRLNGELQSITPRYIAKQIEMIEHALSHKYTRNFVYSIDDSTIIELSMEGTQEDVDVVSWQARLIFDGDLFEDEYEQYKALPKFLLAYHNYLLDIKTAHGYLTSTTDSEDRNF